MLNIISGLKKKVLEDNLTKIMIIIAVIALLYFYKNNSNNEPFNNIGNYTSLTNDNIFNNEKYITLYENVLLDKNKNQYYLNSIMKNTNIVDNGIIVNIGCKTGSFNKLLDNQNINSIGLDRSSEVINYCRNNYSNMNFDIFNINILENVGINYSQPITHIVCLDMEIYYIDDIDLFFKQSYNLLNSNGYIIIHLVDHKKYNNTSLYSRINNFNPNNLSIKKVNDSIIKFNDIIYNTKYRIYPNDFGNKKIWFTETIEHINDNSIYENIHNLNYISSNNIQTIASKNEFELINIIDIDLQHYNDEYLYIFKKNTYK
tara:strand:- start:1283 stop:2230 length:948 start_codon:yes stop_codon:yes gene_type:complete